ncbi:MULTISPECIES: hypothetical protein [unclassified Inquilinus]|uniref:hypothetical protein n=1 Tax=unclassified Inquilinus TaxID=2645927 RepID=UPI003F8E1D40
MVAQQAIELLVGRPVGRRRPLEDGAAEGGEHELVADALPRRQMAGGDRLALQPAKGGAAVGTSMRRGDAAGPQHRGAVRCRVVVLYRHPSRLSAVAAASSAALAPDSTRSRPRNKGSNAP